MRHVIKRIPVKRIPAKLLAAALLLSVLGQTGCASEHPSGISLDKSYFYNTTCEKITGDAEFFANFSAGESGNDESTPVMICGNTPGGLLFAWQDESGVKLLHTDETLAKTDTAQIVPDPDARISGLYSAPDQTFLLVKDRANSWDSGYTWYPADKGGSESGNETLAAGASADAVPAEELAGLEVLDTENDPAGNGYVLTTEKLLSYDAALKCRFKAAIKNVYPVAVAASDDTVYILGEKEDLSFSILCLDAGNGKPGRTIDLKGTNDLAGADLFVREDGSLLIDGTLGIYGLDIAGGTFRVLYGYSDNTIRKPSDFRFSRMLADGSLLVHAQLPSDVGEGGEYRIRIGDTCVKKQEISVAAVTDGQSAVLDLAVNAFNNSGSAYYVTVQTLGGDDAGTSAADYDRLKNEFVKKALSGEAADVLLLKPDMLRSLRSSDALYNLEENVVFTKTVSGEMLTPNIWAAGEENGARYWITPFYSLEGLLVSTDVVESDRSLDMDFFNQICGRYPEAAVMESDTLGGFCTLYYPYIIDYCLTHAGNPDASFFGNLLTQIQGNYRGSDSSDFHYAKIQKREVLFDPVRITSFWTFAGRMSFFDDKASFVTYPGVTGTIAAEEYFAVSASSGQKDGACEFIAFLLSEGFESQVAASGTPGIPLNENVLRASLAADEEAVADKTKIVLITNEQAPDIPHDMDRLEEKFLSIVSSADKYLVQNDEITAILDEEIAGLSAGDKDAAETAQVLGGRIWKV